MNTDDNFQPNWASMPGDTISDILIQKKLSLVDFANEMDSSLDNIKELLHGFVSINFEIANKLVDVLGASVDFWLKREATYRSSVIRLKDHEEKKWIQDLPVKDMVRFGWIANANDLASKCLQYFNVPDVWTWKSKYKDLTAMTSFRKSTTIQSRPGAVSAWLRQGEILSQTIDCKPWNPERLKNSLEYLRPLTKIKDPKVFIPRLKGFCSDCGIALVVIPTPTGCTASGATMFVSAEKAIILMSFKYLSDDHFWFTFFHEAGHLILHSNKHLFIEYDDNERESEEEMQANNFSAEFLIPASLKIRLKNMPITEDNIKKLSMDAGVSLGIVVGQLQKQQRISYEKWNFYKKRYKWDDILS